MTKTGRTYAILGGGGCFGLNTSRYILLAELSARVVGIGRSPMRSAPFSMGIEDNPRYEYHAFHIGHEIEFVLELLDNIQPDVIINYAAQGEGAASWRRSWRFFDTNAVALSRLYEELSGRHWFNPTGLFIHIGTSELYGSVTEPAAEDAPVRPSSPYAVSKAAFDAYITAMVSAGRGVDTCILRPSNCYCPGQQLHRIIPRSVVSGLAGRRVPLHGGGRAQKSYIHATDLSAAIYMVVNATSRRLIYNVGPPSPISIRSLAESCADAVGVKFEDLYDIVDDRPGQDACYWLDSLAIREDLGWKPTIELTDGLTSMVDWARIYLDELRRLPTDYQLRA